MIVARFNLFGCSGLFERESRADDRSGYVYRSACLFNIVGTDNPRPVNLGDDLGGKGALQSLVRRQGIVWSEHAADKRLSADPDEDWVTRAHQDIQMIEKLKVVGYGLSETDSRIDPDRLSIDALRFGSVRPIDKKSGYIRNDIVVIWILLHRLGAALHVHETNCALRICHSVNHLRVAEGGHIVHHRRACQQCLPGNDRLHRVD
jgi:hypothetical protein